MISLELFGRRPFGLIPAVPEFSLIVVLSQCLPDESQQLGERVKSDCFSRGNMLDPALEAPSLDVSFRSKLDNERRRVLPSFHRVWTIG